MFCRWSFAMALAFVLLQGCADSSLSRWNRYNFFRKDDWEAEKKFGQRPIDRVRELEQLSSQGQYLPQPDQARKALEIAEKLPTESDPLLREAMVKALAGLKVAEAETPLKQALKDPDHRVRIAACQSWGSRDAAGAVPALAETLGSDTHLDVKLAAVRSLGGYPGQPAVKALGLALDDPDPALQYRAIQSLKAVSGRDYGNNLYSWREFTQGKEPQAPPQQSWASGWLGPWY